MTISRKAEYALRAVVILAAAAPDRPMQIHDLAESGKIPAKFLEQILLTLKRGGLLRSKRGVGGGYHLEKPARQITVGDIVALIDGGLCHLAAHGQDSGTAEFPGARGLRDSLTEIDELVNEKLASLTIEEILNRDEPDAMLAFGI
ncbi:MAG: Rrf2 family transcriptional regulator [Verrucomicrobiae bacterium]|nr:Rrf2 family transcriptional regulator [Verrucomicrobiae bacterium]